MSVSPMAKPLAPALVAFALLAGCSSQSSSAPPATAAQFTPPIQVPLATHVLPDKQLQVGIKLSGESPFTSKHYGKVLGYFKGTTSTTSQVVTLPMNANVTFVNTDTFGHTASFLGDATKKQAPWPSEFSGGRTASPAGTVISTDGFSTGVLSGGSTSAVYNTGSPGFYMIGCGIHYDSSGMRTVIIVKST